MKALLIKIQASLFYKAKFVHAQFGIYYLIYGSFLPRILILHYVVAVYSPII